MYNVVNDNDGYVRIWTVNYKLCDKRSVIANNKARFACMAKRSGENSCFHVSFVDEKARGNCRMLSNFNQVALMFERYM